MKKMIIVSMITLLSLSLMAMGMGEKGKARRMRAPMMIIPMEVLDKIGVSEEVKTNIKEEGELLKAEMKNGHQKMRDLHNAVKAEFLKESPDRAVIDEKVAAIVELKKEGMLKVEKFKTDTFLKLTLEQRKKALDLFKEKRDNMMKRMMKNGMPPMPPEEGPGPEAE